MPSKLRNCRKLSGQLKARDIRAVTTDLIKVKIKVGVQVKLVIDVKVKVEAGCLTQVELVDGEIALVEAVL